MPGISGVDAFTYSGVPRSHGPIPNPGVPLVEAAKAAGYWRSDSTVASSDVDPDTNILIIQNHLSFC